MSTKKITMLLCLLSLFVVSSSFAGITAPKRPTIKPYVRTVTHGDPRKAIKQINTAAATKVIHKVTK